MNSIDAALILSAIVYERDLDMATADYDHSGSINALDAGDPSKFCVKPNKALPIRQDLEQGKI